MGHRFVCDYCEKVIGTPHYGLDGKQDGYEYPGFFKIALTHPHRDEIYHFCGYTCLAEWISTRLATRFEPWRKKDVNA